MSDSHDRFWLLLKEPRRSVVRKGPWPRRMMRGVIREFMSARPTAYLFTVTIGEDGSPDAQDASEWLEMVDGRSRTTAASHRRTTATAHGDHSADGAPDGR